MTDILVQLDTGGFTQTQPLCRTVHDTQGNTVCQFIEEEVTGHLQRFRRSNVTMDLAIQGIGQTLGGKACGLIGVENTLVIDGGSGIDLAAVNAGNNHGHFVG